MVKDVCMMICDFCQYYDEFRLSIRTEDKFKYIHDNNVIIENVSFIEYSTHYQLMFKKKYYIQPHLYMNFNFQFFWFNQVIELYTVEEQWSKSITIINNFFANYYKNRPIFFTPCKIDNILQEYVTKKLIINFKPSDDIVNRPYIDFICIPKSFLFI